MSAEIHEYPDLARYSADAISLIKQMRSLPQESAMTLILKHAFANSIKIVWVVMCGLAGLALLATVFIKGYDLNQALATEQGFVDTGERVSENDTEKAALAEAGVAGSV
jgi:hypothetical protein